MSTRRTNDETYRQLAADRAALIETRGSAARLEAGAAKFIDTHRALDLTLTVLRHIAPELTGQLPVSR